MLIWKWSMENMDQIFSLPLKRMCCLCHSWQQKRFPGQDGHRSSEKQLLSFLPILHPPLLQLSQRELTRVEETNPPPRHRLQSPTVYCYPKLSPSVGALMVLYDCRVPSHFRDVCSWENPPVCVFFPPERVWVGSLITQVQNQRLPGSRSDLRLSGGRIWPCSTNVCFDRSRGGIGVVSAGALPHYRGLNVCDAESLLIRRGVKWVIAQGCSCRAAMQRQVWEQDHLQSV